LNRETDLTAALQAHLQLQGWPVRTVGRLPPCHAHDQPVTPYFQLGGWLRRPWNACNVDGCVGVFHRGFEAQWATRYRDHPSIAAFPTCALLVNFRELHELRSIPSRGPFKTQIDALATGIVQFLNSLPATEDDLRAAVQRDLLGPYALRTFAHPIEIGKFNAFVEFVKSDRTGGS
jgi:hypothetical protein